MVNNKNISDYLYTVIRTFLKNWIEHKHTYYLIKICSLYIDENSKEFIVKYQFANKRICSEMPLKDFLNSEFMHLVHPQQLYYLGFDTHELINSKSINDAFIKKTISRFKRFFIKNENS